MIKLKNSRMDLFKCQKCSFYPLDFQRQIYFLNINDFKCPVCNQQKSFFKQQNYFVKSSIFSRKLSKISQKFINSSKKHLTQNISNCISKQYNIFIEKTNIINSTLYVKPMDSKLKFYWHMNIQDLLSQGNHILLRLYYKQLIKAKGKQFVKQKRKVSSLQYLLCCLDSYINVQMLEKYSNNQINVNLIVIDKISKKNDKSINLLKSYKFQIEKYKNYQDYVKNKNSMKNNIKNFQPKNKQLKIFEKNVMNLIKFIRGQIQLQLNDKEVYLNELLKSSQQSFRILFCRKFVQAIIQICQDKFQTVFYFKSQKLQSPQKIKCKYIQLIPQNNVKKNFQQFLRQKNIVKSQKKNQQHKESINYIFWRQITFLDKKQNPPQIKYTKTQSSELLNNCKINQQDESNVYKIVQSELSKFLRIPIKNVKIQRILCQSDNQQQIFTFVFNYKSLIQDNFEELDCLQIDSLSFELEKLSNSYLQKKKQDNINKAFKKKHDVLLMSKQVMVQRRLVQFYNNNDDQQRQFL